MTERVAVGYIPRTKGVRGAVKVEVLTHRLSRFDELSQVVLQKKGRADYPLEIEYWRPEQPGILMKFVGIDTPEKAREVLVKGYITIEPHEVVPLPEDLYYISDLVGCAVQDESGQHLGKIIEVLQMPSTDVYVVRDGQRELLVPAVGDYIVEISIPRRQLVVKGIEGLLNVS
jgi:16S rRNA processing protein RimM